MNENNDTTPWRRALDHEAAVFRQGGGGADQDFRAGDIAGLECKIAGVTASGLLDCGSSLFDPRVFDISMGHRPPEEMERTVALMLTAEDLRELIYGAPLSQGLGYRIVYALKELTGG